MRYNITKYILTMGLIILMIPSFISCKKFLEEKQVASLTQDYYNDETGLTTLINGLYIISRVKHEWDGNGAKLIEPETDAYMHVDINLARIASASYGNNVSTIAGNVNNYIGGPNTATTAPMGCYPHINNCNIALDIIDNVKPGRYGSDEAFRKIKRGEITFLRAWAYYLISNQLGDVPLVLTPRREDNGTYYFPKAKLEDVYKQIIADARYAYENLPATYTAATDRGRLTKWAAGHLLAKVYLNRAQAVVFQNSSEAHLKKLFKGNVASDLDSCIQFATETIAGKGGAGALATDYWTLFNPAVSEAGAHHPEVIWAAQFDLNTALGGRFGGNRSCNYHVCNYLDQTGVVRAMAYGRPFATYKPTDWAYDNFRNKVDDSRYYKTFQYEFISTGASSFSWNATSAAWWNANKPAGEPTVSPTAQRITVGKRALIYLENQKSEALDSLSAMSRPYQFMVRWLYSSVTGRYYYRQYIDGAGIGLATGRRNFYLSSKKMVDPNRGGSSSEANVDSESGTRDVIIMRLAETFLIRAEAYGRKGQYGQAVNDINVLRQRAAYKSGEARPAVLVEWEPGGTVLTPGEKQPPYFANGTSYSRITVSENNFTPGTPEAIAEGYIPTVGSKEQMFIHFIYNEKAREFLGEGLAWEDQHNTGILFDRVDYFNQMASSRTGLWPVAFNTEGGNGQNGNGKGQYQKFHTFRPWPNAYLVQLTDENGKTLDAPAMTAYQNSGY